MHVPALAGVLAGSKPRLQIIDIQMCYDLSSSTDLPDRDDANPTCHRPTEGILEARESISRNPYQVVEVQFFAQHPMEFVVAKAAVGDNHTLMSAGSASQTDQHLILIRGSAACR